jgi:hypothetical protein
MKRNERKYDEGKELNRLRAKWKKVMVDLQDYAIQRGIIVKRFRRSRAREQTEEIDSE